MRHVRLERVMSLRWLKIALVCFVAAYSLSIMNGDAARALDVPPSLPDPQTSTDLIPPTVPINGYPHHTVKTTHLFNFTWAASQDEDTERVKYEFRANKQLDITEKIPEAGETWYSSLLVSPQIDFASIPGASDGTLYWQVRAVDAAENKSDWSSIWQVTVDTRGPTLSFHQPTAGTLFGGPLRLSIPFSAVIEDSEDIAAYHVELDGVDVTDKMVIDNQTTRVTLNTSFSALQLTNGNHLFKIIATDSHGNMSELHRLFGIDTVAPLLSVNIGENQVLKGKVTFELSAVEANPDVYTISFLDAQDEAYEVTLEDVVTQSSTKAYELDTTKVANGTYQVRFFGRDLAGNETELIRTVTVDNSVAVKEVVPPDVFVGMNDPLLDELSKQLSQPFVAPRIIDIAPLAPKSIAKEHEGDLLLSTALLLPETDHNAQPPVVIPSESGWRIFGIVWYWWLFLAMAATFAYRRWKVVQLAPI